MLPLATNTSLGQIVNARTLETQISRLLASPFREVQTLGALLKDAARNPSVNINQEKWGDLVAQVRELNADLGERAAQALLKEVRVSPTLVKYAEANQYEIETRREFQHAARELMAGAAIEKAPLVDLLEDDALEIELATTLLYQNSHYSYRQIREKVSGLSGSRVHELVDLGTKHRGRHDELLRAFSAGQRLKFDILMDVGGFRDMHRHRRCVQICQDFTAAHGFDTPEDLVTAGLGSRYEKVMKNSGEVSAKLAAGASDGAAHNALYVLPMGYRCRALFKMDFAEALYISELRTTPAGHFSYRNVAYAMYEKVTERYPALAKHFRVTDVRKPVDLLQR
jgi:thymidylate synthase ThyX